MLLPQSSAFAALKNRLNSVCNIGLLHTGPRAYVNSTGTIPPSSPSSPNHFPNYNYVRRHSTEAHLSSAGLSSPPSAGLASSSSGYERSTGGRTKPREDNAIRWGELLDKFKNVQERARRSQRGAQRPLDQDGNGAGLPNPSLAAALSAAATAEQPGPKEKVHPDAPRGGAGAGGLGGTGPAGGRGVTSPDGVGPQKGTSTPTTTHKHRSSLPNLGRLGIGPRKSKR